MHTHAHMHASTHAHIRTHMHTCTHAHAHMHTCKHTHTHARVDTQIYNICIITENAMKYYS